MHTLGRVAFRSCDLHSAPCSSIQLLRNARSSLYNNKRLCGSVRMAASAAATAAGTAATAAGTAATAAGTAATAAAASSGGAASSSSQQQRVRLAVVGDVHGQWSPADAAALQALHADAVLWVGDIGNEDVGLVQQIAALDGFQKAVVLGNHDSWFTLTDRGRQRAARQKLVSTANSSSSPPSSQSTDQQQQQQQETPVRDRVQQQLDVLGEDHVGYGHKALQGTNISVVGARAFSKGGKSFSSIADFMARFGVGDMQQSAEKVLDVINSQVPPGNVLVMLAHNGPAGLGADPHSICGVDWLPEAGDHGDVDLQLVLQRLQQAGRRVALLLHGHMHHMIKGGGRRQMVHVDPSGTVVLNAATVPRVVPLPHSNSGAAASRHHFLLVDLQQGAPVCAADVWVQTEPLTPGGGEGSASSSSSKADPAVKQQQRNFLASAAAAMHAVQHSKSKGKAQKQAAAQVTQDEAARRLRLQAPQQLTLLQQQEPQVIDGFKVQVAEVYEVLRSSVQPDEVCQQTPAAAADTSLSGPGPDNAMLCWQYFDAHLGKWVMVSAGQAGALGMMQADGTCAQQPVST